MKIVVADGKNRADYIISMFNTKDNELVVINEDEDACRYLSANNDIPVMRGRCTRENELREAGAENCDLFIALAQDDYKNYVACKMVKTLLGGKRCIATVLNPKNVSLFKQLGIDSVVSSTYLLAETVRNTTTVENMINALSIEDNKVKILEFVLEDGCKVIGKTLADINISNIGSISCIIRNDTVMIPNGQIELMTNDKVLIVTTAENTKKIIEVFQRKH